jgi:hypothetical protein
MKKFLTFRTVAIAIKVLGFISMVLVTGEFLGLIAPLPKATIEQTPLQLGIGFFISLILFVTPLSTLQKWVGGVVEKKIKE